MNKNLIKVFFIIAILAIILGILTGCGSESQTENNTLEETKTVSNTETENVVDTSSLAFNPAGVWVDLSDGEPMFEILKDGSLNYGADEPSTWEVIGENKIKVDLKENGQFEIQLVQEKGYNIIGNENATFCLEQDYEGAHEAIYVPAMSEQ